LGIGLSLFALVIVVSVVLAGLQARVRRSRRLPVYGTVADFALTNQSGARVSRANLLGRVWVADVIFTRCAGPCLRMSRQMKELQEALPPGSRSRLVTITTDPEYDTPPILARYAGRFDADTNRWMFLTGPRAAVADVVSGSLKLTAIERKPEERTSAEDLFVHSTVFVIVDAQGRLRGVFDTGGEGTDWVLEKQKILQGVGRLEGER
jgi:cytochrome oxidase Cu insertion factor (SCO1/SenC/PrrC family)